MRRRFVEDLSKFPLFSQQIWIPIP